MGEKRSQEQPTRIERLAKNKGTKGFTIPTHSDKLLSALPYSFLACMPLYMI